MAIVTKSVRTCLLIGCWSKSLLVAKIFSNVWAVCSWRCSFSQPNYLSAHQRVIRQKCFTLFLRHPKESKTAQQFHKRGSFYSLSLFYSHLHTNTYAHTPTNVHMHPTSPFLSDTRSHSPSLHFASTINTHTHSLTHYFALSLSLSLSLSILSRENTTKWGHSISAFFKKELSMYIHPSDVNADWFQG